jgi:hypothetical protein
MTFFDLLTYWGGVEGVAAEASPATGTHLSTLAIELPHFVTPAIAGLTVGSVVGVVGFVAVMLLVGRGSRRPSRRRPSPEMMVIPPYGMMQRETPLPPAFGGRAYNPSSPAFTPSTALSARVFAKMGYAADADEPMPSDPMLSVEIDMDEPSGPVAAQVQAVTVSPVVVLSDSRSGESAKDKSSPHPLGIIKSSSPAMRAAPISDLSFDDSPTEIGETYFDEPPQPRRRTDPPRIRKIVPGAARFTEQTRNG